MTEAITAQAHYLSLKKNPEEVNETAMIKAVTIQAQKTCH